MVGLSRAFARPLQRGAFGANAQKRRKAASGAPAQEPPQQSPGDEAHQAPAGADDIGGGEPAAEGGEKRKHRPAVLIAGVPNLPDGYILGETEIGARDKKSHRAPRKWVVRVPVTVAYTDLNSKKDSSRISLKFFFETGLWCMICLTLG